MSSREPRKEVLGLSTVTYKYQVTIPRRVREKCKLKGGDTLMFVEENGRVFLAKSTDI